MKMSKFTIVGGVFAAGLCLSAVGFNISTEIKSQQVDAEFGKPVPMGVVVEARAARMDRMILSGIKPDHYTQEDYEVVRAYLLENTEKTLASAR